MIMPVFNAGFKPDAWEAQGLNSYIFFTCVTRLCSHPNTAGVGLFPPCTAGRGDASSSDGLGVRADAIHAVADGRRIPEIRNQHQN